MIEDTEEDMDVIYVEREGMVLHTIVIPVGLILILVVQFPNKKDAYAITKIFWAKFGLLPSFQICLCNIPFRSSNMKLTSSSSSSWVLLIILSGVVVALSSPLDLPYYIAAVVEHYPDPQVLFIFIFH